MYVLRQCGMKQLRNLVEIVTNDGDKERLIFQWTLCGSLSSLSK